MDIRIEDDKPEPARNVLGEPMDLCCEKPLTGFYRNGRCDTGPDDHGVHTVCIRVTNKFLAFSKTVGNDLSTPMPEMNFPGLIEGDQWCLCLNRWREALEANCAPLIQLESTHINALEFVDLETLKQYAAKDALI